MERQKQEACTFEGTCVLGTSVQSTNRRVVQVYHHSPHKLGKVNYGIKRAKAPDTSAHIQNGAVSTLQMKFLAPDWRAHNGQEFLSISIRKSFTASSPIEKYLSSFSRPRLSSFKSRICCSIDLMRLINVKICSFIFRSSCCLGSPLSISAP
jgi:hypothetical protein